MTTYIGTAYFVSRLRAMRYYRGQGYPGSTLEILDVVNQKVAAGEIHIGQPTLQPGDTLITIDNDCRYGIMRASR